MFERLDFLYMPSHDAAHDVEHFGARLGGELVFAIEAFGTRVAMLRLHPGRPDVLLAEHLAGDQPVLVYRVAELERAMDELQARGAGFGARFEIPHGPGIELVNPGPQRLALYELTRPHAAMRLAGRRDF
ncbi:MAG: hypothetical protein JO153_04040 [Solirubrobacterales bacterium]|nr:hypothetical protein [Solirubrobacterales bacterium]